MAFQHTLQASRYELKYLIDEAQAQSIRTFIRRFLVYDPNANPELAYRYHVHSLYCDSRDLQLYKATQCGMKNRFKLRIRFYNDDMSQPTFLEIKRRIGSVICKERATISKENARRLLFGHHIPGCCLIGSKREKGQQALDQFCTLYRQIGALPCVYVSYTREAFVQPDGNDVRITFDRDLTSSRFDVTTAMHVPKRPTPAEMRPVLLELKFTDRHPVWMRELVSSLNLWRVSFAKYVQCVNAVRCPWADDLGVDIGVAS